LDDGEKQKEVKALRTTHYFAPESLDEALELLAEYGDRATILAGGTDVMVDMAMGRLKPEVILYIGNLPLNGIEERDGALFIGPTTKMATLARSPLVAEKAPVLAEAASKMGSPLVRNLATVGGNLVTASPAADTASALLGLGAEVRLSCTTGERWMPLEDFFTGPKECACEAPELLTEIRIPLSGGKRGSRFIKLGRRKAVTLSVVNVTVVLDFDDGACRQARIALGAVAPTPIRSRRAEALLTGQVVNDELIAEAAQAALSDISPIDDGRASAWYRRKVTAVLVARALKEAVA